MEIHIDQMKALFLELAEKLVWLTQNRDKIETISSLIKVGWFKHDFEAKKSDSGI